VQQFLPKWNPELLVMKKGVYCAQKEVRYGLIAALIVYFILDEIGEMPSLQSRLLRVFNKEEWSRRLVSRCFPVDILFLPPTAH